LRAARRRHARLLDACVAARPSPCRKNQGMETAEVVVIGGGAMGASVAWHLRALGIEDVVLLERDSLAAGSTSRSAGGIRSQFSDELNIRIALRSMDEFERMGRVDFRRYCDPCLLDRPAALRPV